MFFKKSRQKSIAEPARALLNYFVNLIMQCLHMSLQLKRQKPPSRFRHTPVRKEFPPFCMQGACGMKMLVIYTCHVMAELEYRLAP